MLDVPDLLIEQRSLAVTMRHVLLSCSQSKVCRVLSDGGFLTPRGQ